MEQFLNMAGQLIADAGTWLGILGGILTIIQQGLSVKTGKAPRMIGEIIKGRR